MSELTQDRRSDTTGVHAPARRFRFVLLCHQRSGSNALSSMLNADPRIALYGQLFNHFYGYWRRNRRMGLTRYKAHPAAMQHFGQKPPLRPRLERAFVSMTPRQIELGAFMDQFWRRYKTDQTLDAVGFKLHDLQVSDRDLADLATNHADGVVVLWRRNLLKAAVSWGYAVKTDVWTRKSSSGGQQPVFRLDPDEIGWFIDKTRREVEGWKRIMAESGANTLELVYEDDVETRRLEKLYGFLRVPYSGPPEFRTKRLAGSRYEHIANAEELDRRFGCDDTGRLFG